MNPILDSDSDSLELTRKHLLDSLQFPLMAVMAIWVTHLLRLAVDGSAGDYGVISRSEYGLRGIISGPLVHGSWGHLLSNSLPLFVLSAIIFYFFKKVAFRAFWLIYFSTGLAVWVFARPVSHIGASGVVYGLVSFVFFNGVFRRSARSIILALFVLFFYSGMFAGILPDQEGVSWESHLLGSLMGALASFWFKSELEDDEIERPSPFAAERYADATPFLPADIFEKTKQQRAEEAEALRQQQAYEEWLRQQQQPPFGNQTGTW
jgi:membrane associated rhomboid family serine protease